MIESYDNLRRYPTSLLRSEKHLPAYGKELLSIRENGMVPAGPYVVVCLDRWNWGRAFSRCVVPLDLDPTNTNFTFVAGLDCVLIFDPQITKPERVDSAIRELLQCRPTSLRTLADADPIEWRWIKSRAVGIELEEFQ